MSRRWKDPNWKHTKLPRGPNVRGRAAKIKPKKHHACMIIVKKCLAKKVEEKCTNYIKYKKNYGEEDHNYLFLVKTNRHNEEKFIKGINKKNLIDGFIVDNKTLGKEFIGDCKEHGMIAMGDLPDCNPDVCSNFYSTTSIKNKTYLLKPIDSQTLSENLGRFELVINNIRYYKKQAIDKTLH